MVSVIFNAAIKFLSSPPNLQKGLAKNTLLIPSGKNYSVVLILILVKIENDLKKYREAC